VIANLIGLSRFLYLHDKHMAAYSSADDIPPDVKAAGMATLIAQREDIIRDLGPEQGWPLSLCSLCGRLLEPLIGVNGNVVQNRGGMVCEACMTDEKGYA
jgi:hypothetical protein